MGSAPYIIISLTWDNLIILLQRQRKQIGYVIYCANNSKNRCGNGTVAFQARIYVNLNQSVHKYIREHPPPHPASLNVPGHKS